MNTHDYKIKQIKKAMEIYEKESLDDIDKLELIITDIYPYSRYWRFGMIKALRHAIKLLKEEKKNESIYTK